MIFSQTGQARTGCFLQEERRQKEMLRFNCTYGRAVGQGEMSERPCLDILNELHHVPKIRFLIVIHGAMASVFTYGHA